MNFNLDAINRSTIGSTLSSSQILEKGKLKGDYSKGFSHMFNSVSDKEATPQGAANNEANKNRTIDKTSVLYEKAMELENYFVKQLLSSMRQTIHRSGDDFASQMYDDMLYDEYSTNMTRNAGFGLADQIYLSLKKE